MSIKKGKTLRAVMFKGIFFFILFSFEHMRCKYLKPYADPVMQFPKSIKINQWDLPANKLKPPKVITFDAYNTLYSTTLPVMEQYCKIGLKYGIEADPQHLTVKFPKSMIEEYSYLSVILY